MNAKSYLNLILTIIALNLTYITMSEIEVLSEANASDVRESSGKVAKVPVNQDGSIDVRVKRIPEEMEVKIEDVSEDAFKSLELPVKINHETENIVHEPLELTFLKE